MSKKEKSYGELLMEELEEEKRQKELAKQQSEIALDQAYQKLFAVGEGILFSRKAYQSPQELRQRFFYMYVERGNKYHKFSEKLFDDEDLAKGNYDYSRGMVNGFIVMLEAIRAQKESGIAAKLDVEFVNALHDSASHHKDKSCVRTAKDRIRDGFKIHDASLPYLQQVAQDNYAIILHSLDQTNHKNSVGFAHNARSYFEIIFYRIRTLEDGDESMPQMIAWLIEAYEKSILEAGEDSQKKIAAMAMIIHDLNLLHPYKDANARTFNVLLLNFLLLKEGLNPAMIFSISCLESFTKDEAAIAIYEGQKACEEFFLANQDIGDLFSPLTQELREIFEQTSRYLEEEGIMRSDALASSIGLFQCKRRLEELKLKQKKGEEVLPQDFAELESNFLKSSSEAAALFSKKHLPVFLQYNMKEFLEIFPEFKPANLFAESMEASEFQKFARGCTKKNGFFGENFRWNEIENSSVTSLAQHLIYHYQYDDQFLIINNIAQEFQKILLVSDLEKYTESLAEEIKAESQKNEELLAKKDDKKLQDQSVENPDANSLEVKTSETLGLKKRDCCVIS